MITDPLERRAAFDWVTTHAWKQDTEAMLAHSPLVEVTFQVAAA